VKRNDGGDRQIDLALEVTQDFGAARATQGFDLGVRDAEHHRLAHGTHERDDQRPENDENEEQH
jgi:hypothetical protein